MKQIDQHDLNLISGWLQAFADGEQLRSRGEHQQIMATLTAIKVLPDAVQPTTAQALAETAQALADASSASYVRDDNTNEVHVRASREYMENNATVCAALYTIRDYMTRGHQPKIMHPAFQPEFVPYEQDFTTGVVTMRATEEVISDFPAVLQATKIMKALSDREKAGLAKFTPVVDPADNVLSEKTLRKALDAIGDGVALKSMAHPGWFRWDGKPAVAGGGGNSGDALRLRESMMLYPLPVSEPTLEIKMMTDRAAEQINQMFAKDVAALMYGTSTLKVIHEKDKT